MKKPAKITKKTSIKKKITLKKSIPKKKIISRSIKAKKLPIKKASVKRSKVVNRKNKKHNLKKAVVALIGLTCIIAVSVFAYLNLNKSDTVLGAFTNTYTVSEDELAMFATLAYEDPYRTRLFVNSDGIPSTQKDYSKPIAVCNSKNISVYYGSTDEEKNLTCVKSQTLHATTMESGSRTNMFRSDDMIGTVRLTKILSGVDPLTQDSIIAAGMSSDSLSGGEDSTNLEKIAKFLGTTIQGAIAAIATIENSEEYYFSDIASVDSAKFLDNWVLVDAYDAASVPKLTTDYGIMSAQTFKRGKDIVIAYRGTDLTDIADWLINDAIGYAFKNDTFQDKEAKKYALKIAKAFNEGITNPADQYNIYITGHSLGGYLAQMAASELVPVTENGVSSNPYNLKRVVYYNGMGLFFSEKSRTNPKNQQVEARNRLIAFNTKDGKFDDKILLVHMFGDPVSSLGYHFGQVKTIKPTDKNGNPFRGVTDAYDVNYTDNFFEEWQSDMSEKYPILWSKLRLGTLNAIQSTLGTFASNPVLPFSFTPYEVTNAVYWYDSNALLTYMMTTHATDLFFYNKLFYNYSLEYDATTAYIDKTENGAVVKKAFVEPQLDSINSLLYNNRTQARTFDYAIKANNDSMVGYYAPICSFTLNNPNSADTDNVISIERYQYIDGTIICNHPRGMARLERPLAPNAINVSGASPQAYITGVSPATILQSNAQGSPMSYKWTVYMRGTSAGIIDNREATQSMISLRAGFIHDSYLSMGNETTVATSTVKLTGDITYEPEVQPGASFGCSFTSTPGSVTSKFWPWRWEFGNVTIKCISPSGLKDGIIRKADITTTGGLRLGSIEKLNTGATGEYIWNVRVRGAYGAKGSNGVLKLKPGAVMNNYGVKNDLQESSSINIR